MSYKQWFPYVLIALVALLIYGDMFLNSGFLVKSDNPVHIVEAKYLADTLLPEYKWINGWYPFEAVGNPTQMYSYQLGLWVVVFLYLIGINLFLAYKLSILLSAISISAALFYVLQKRFSVYIALFVAVAPLFLRDYGKVFLAGMWIQAFGIALLILLLDQLSNRINLKTTLGIGILLALIILAHPFVAIAAGYTIGCSLLLNVWKEKKLKVFGYYILMFIGAFALSWFYIYPYVETFGWYGTEYGWGLGSSLLEIGYKLVGIFFSLKPHTSAFPALIAGNYNEAVILFVKSIFENLPILVMNMLGLTGIYFYVRKKIKDNFLDITFVFMIVSLFLGTGFWFLFEWGRSIPFLGAILSYRLVYCAKIGLFIFAAYGLKEFWEKKRLFKVSSYIVLTCMIIGLLVGSFTIPESYTTTTENTPIYEETEQMWSWVKENVPYDARILNQNFYGNIEEPLVTFDSILPAMAYYYTGHQYVGAWYTTVFPLEKRLTTENGMIFGEKIEDITTDKIVKEMKIFNIKYVIAVEEKLKNKLTGANQFKEIYSSENYKIFELEGYTPSWTNGKLISFENQKIIIEGEDEVSVKVAYHPYWKARVNGEEIPVIKDENDLIQVNVPNTEQIIVLEFVPKKPAHLTVSGVSILLISAYLIALKRKKA